MGRAVAVTTGSQRSRAVDAGGFLVSDAWFPEQAVFGLHFHDRAVVGVVLHGALSIDAGMRHTECVRHSVYVEPRGERHAHRIVRGAHIVSLQPDPDRSAMVEPLGPALDRIRSFADIKIATRASQLLQEFQYPDVVTPLAMESLALDIVTLIARTDGDDRPYAEPPPWLRRVRDYIHDCCTTPLRIDELAGAAGVHPTMLVRAWRRHYRTAIGNYARSVRLEWTRLRLLESDDPLSRIAVRAGFADQSHFTRSFKALFGMSPGRYRSLRRRR